MGRMDLNVDIQYFASSGTWIKPRDAARVNCILRGGEAGRNILTGRPEQPGDPGATLASFDAGDLPAEMPVTVGRGGGHAATSSAGLARSIAGADGVALIITHLGRPAPRDPA